MLFFQPFLPLSNDIYITFPEELNEKDLPPQAGLPAA